jgi:hypothetical protein
MFNSTAGRPLPAVELQLLIYYRWIHIKRNQSSDFQHYLNEHSHIIKRWKP